MLETQSIPLRNYLMKHVMPTLTQGLIDCCKVRPDDAVDYLVSFKYIIQVRMQEVSEFFLPVCTNTLWII